MKQKTFLITTLLITSSIFFTSCMATSLTVRGQIPFGIDYEVDITPPAPQPSYPQDYPNQPNYPNQPQNPNNQSGFERYLLNRTWYSQGPFSMPYSDFYTSNHSLKINPGSNKLMIQKDYFINNRYYDTLRIVYNYQVSGNWDNKTQVRLSNPQVYDLSGRRIRENALPKNIMEKDIYKYNPVGFDFSFLPNAFVMNDQPNSGINYTFQ